MVWTQHYTDIVYMNVSRDMMNVHASDARNLMQTGEWSWILRSVDVDHSVGDESV